MTVSQSKLLIQLQKQLRNVQKITIDEDHLDDIYQMLTKIQSKNLIFIQLLVFLIQKGFVKNQHKMYYYMDVYDSIKGIVSDQITNNFKQKQDDQDKFNRKKFIKFFKTISKKFYPSDPLGFQNNIYKIIVSNQHQDDIRIKMDDNIKKLITRQTINILRNYQRQLEIVYEIYLAQNFNNKMAFSWQEIKYLQKKLPVIALFRFLWDCQICPQYISPTHFFDVVSKIIPPHSLLAGSSQKQSLFYSPENIINYVKESIPQKKMKLLQGDIGINYFQLQVILLRLSIDVTKQKSDFVKAFQTFLSMIKLKDIIANKGQTKQKPNRFQQNVKSYFEQTKKANKNNVQVQKREGKKRIQQILQLNEQIQQDSRIEFKDSSINDKDLLNIKKSLDDDHLPQIPQRPTIQKQNNSQYKIQEKHIVIGQQLPKLQQKNKPAAPKKQNKKDDNSRKFKLEQTVKPQLSTDHYNQIIKVPRKMRMNNEFPIILMQAIYPTDIPNLYLNPKAQIYLQTAYIHLGERSYQKAFINYIKARTICEATKNQTAQFYFYILQAQIYEAAARDEMALLNYNKAKQLANTTNKDIILKYIAYKGLACCLYHMEEYQYSMRCFLKAKELKNDKIEIQSVESAIMENNLGCIMMIMNRNNQAMKHFAISQSIMDLKLGKFHEKSVVVQKNQAKNKKAYLEMAPQYKTMWRTYVQKTDIKKTVPTNSKNTKKK